jgi:hypothetical protein
MSNHPGMLIPMLTVMARVGAVGKTLRGIVVWHGGAPWAGIPRSPE